MFIEALTDSLADTLKLLPFLFITYLLMEYLEYNSKGKLTNAVGSVGKAGPLLGGIVGIVPQCGFSAAAAGLFAGGVVSIGTLLAAFLSTSDEMLPLFISHGTEAASIIKILLIKVALAIISGYAVEMILRLFKIKTMKKTIHEFCESEHCGCENKILKPAIKHTVMIWIFVFAVTLALDLLIEYTGFEAVSDVLSKYTIISVPLVCLIGLIPNCASSVVITECYLSGIISGGVMMSGLLTGCGIGTLVLFRTNKRISENIKIVAVLYFIGIFWGFVLEALGVTF